MRTKCPVATIALALVACGSPSRVEPPARAAAPDSMAAVRGFQEALELRDADAMLAYVADDVVSLRVDDDDVAVEVRGRDDLRADLERRLASRPGAQSVIEESFEVGAFVAVRERTTWQDDEGIEHSGIALTVYEVEAGRIRRVSHYPLQRDDR